MATIVEKDFETVLTGRIARKIEAYLTDEYSRDAEDVADGLTDVLGLDDVEELPRFSVEVVLHLGNKAYTVSGLEVVEAEDEEDTEDE